MKLAYALAATPALLLTCAAAEVQTVVYGTARAEDGDSLLVEGKRVRLFGIDAPEFHQACTRNGQNWPCGAAAADQLTKLASGKRVMCVSAGVDQYQRILARCTAGSTDLNRAMVALGYAVAYRHYSLDYVPDEESAKANRRGLWAGSFQLPSDFRHRGAAQARSGSKRLASGPSSSVSPAQVRAECNIKGNRNRRGQWIYHLPGMPYYDQTRPEEIFCTEQQAQAAGYRRAIVQ